MRKKSKVALEKRKSEKNTELSFPDNPKKIRLAEMSPKEVEENLAELLYRNSRVVKSFTRGFFRAYDSFADANTKYGRSYLEKNDTIEGAIFDYVVADLKTDQNAQLILMGGLSRGKCWPLLQYNPALSILLQYGEKKVEPATLFCEKFPFSEEDFDAMIYMDGSLEKPKISFKVNEPRLENVVASILLELRKETGAETESDEEDDW